MRLPDSYPLDTPASVDADAIAAAWERELPNTPVHSIPIVTPIWRLAKLLADDRRRFLYEEGIDPATLDLLSTLRRSGEPYTLTTRELTRQCLVSAGAISQRVTKAEKEGLITRGPARGRPKSVSITLTKAGHDLTEIVVDALLTREAMVVGGEAEVADETLAAGLRNLLHDVQRRLLTEPENPVDRRRPRAGKLE